MQPHEIIIAIASTLTAVGTILGVIKLWWKRITKQTIKSLMAELDERDIKGIPHIVQQNNNINDISHKIEELRNLVTKNDIYTRRNEILVLISTHPQEVKAIDEAFDEYKKHGGNSYIEDIVNTWRKQYTREVK